MITETLASNSLLARINFWFNVKYRQIILKKTDELSGLAEQSADDTRERIMAGVKVVSELGRATSEVCRVSFTGNHRGLS